VDVGAAESRRSSTHVVFTMQSSYFAYACERGRPPGKVAAGLTTSELRRGFSAGRASQHDHDLVQVSLEPRRKTIAAPFSSHAKPGELVLIERNGEALVSVPTTEPSHGVRRRRPAAPRTARARPRRWSAPLPLTSADARSFEARPLPPRTDSRPEYALLSDCPEFLASCVICVDSPDPRWPRE